MEYKDFEKLYHDDPVIFHTALEIFVDNGRDIIGFLPDAEIGAEAARLLSARFSDKKIDETVSAVRGFAGLKTLDLLSYASRCGIKLEDDPLDEPGVCPLCGGVLAYGEEAAADGPHTVGWTCENCGATGKEAYREVFDCHFDVLDSIGNPVFKRNQS